MCNLSRLKIVSSEEELLPHFPLSTVPTLALLFVGGEKRLFGNLADYIVYSQNTASAASGFPVSFESV
jgi:hypothetical protein